MSIQTYNQDVFYDERMVQNGQAVPNLTDKGLCMEFMISIMTTIGRDKTRARTCNFTIVGGSSGGGSVTFAPAMISDIIDAGARMASNIADLSKGVLSGFYAKLGKFRPDEVPVDVASGDNSRAVIDLSNNPNEEYGLNPCDSTNENPAVSAGSRIYIPWLRDDVSRQDVVQSLGDWEYTKNGVTYSLGHCRFRNDAKTQIVAYPTTVVRNIQVGSYSRKHPGFLQNNDSALGWEDNVVSEEYNSNIEGVDDRTPVVPEP